ncbi:unnamed protein product [Ectocarpus sp. CCAP 1310/34]|nr:unnamed protein product [Ectocarpus sp. CCAP 1310/34]
MGRRQVDPEQARKACEAVRGGMKIREASVYALWAIDGWSSKSRLDGEVAMKAKVGPATALSEEEENSLEDVLLYAGRHCLAVGRLHLLETVIAVQRRSPDPLGSREGSGEGLAGWLPQEAPTGVGADDSHLRVNQNHRGQGASHRRVLQVVGSSPLDEHKPEADHVHNTDETREDVLVD